MKTNVLLFVYSGDIEPIPSIIQNAIDHLCQWRLIPESRKPNSCVINFFDEVISLTIRPHLILQIIFVVCIYIFITCYRVNFHNLTLNHHIWTIQSPLCFCLKPQWYLAVFLLVIKMGTTKAPLLSQSSKGN